MLRLKRIVKMRILYGDVGGCMNILDQFGLFTTLVMDFLILAYAYQVVYICISIFKSKKKELKDTPVRKRFAIFISARNEESVIAELLDSLNAQQYPKEHYDVYVVADNCTDHTAEIAHLHGAVVYERFNKEEVGKGYALNYLYTKVSSLKGRDYYDAFVVFDADNIVDCHFLMEVNKKLASGKYDALTTYRNSKNFGTNWLSAAYSTWFLHEARHLNYVRDMIGAQCMISGTGFVVTSSLMDENDGWPYYFLTEDIQFSVASTIQNKRIGYVDSAMLYDEQPTTMEQSWKQRLRWAKGFYQIDGKYLGSLTKGLCKEKGKRIAYYDILMTCLPCTLLTVILVALALWILGATLFMPYYISLVLRQEMIHFLTGLLLGMWGSMMLLAAITVVMEWKRIPATPLEKIKYLPMFPMYMLTYIPITVQALYTNVTWTPIQHYSTSQLAMKK